MVTTTRPRRRVTGITARPRRRKPLVPMSARMSYVPGVLYLTRRRAAQLFDREARRYLGMSGEEFARRYRAGEVSDLDHSNVTRVSMLLPWADGQSLTEKAVAGAVRGYLDALHRALGCVTRARLALLERTRLVPDTPYAIGLRGADAVTLRGEVPLRLVARQIVRVVPVDGSEPFATPFRPEVVGYFYTLSTPNDRELLAFHWTPEATDPNSVTFAHLHIGPAIVGGQTTIRPRDLHKVHVPTGYVSLAAVVRLAIAELRVAPLRSDWDPILRAAAEAERGGRVARSSRIDRGERPGPGRANRVS